MKWISVWLMLLVCRIEAFVALVGRKTGEGIVTTSVQVGLPSTCSQIHVRAKRNILQQMQRDPYIPDDVTVKQKIQVFLYRITLISASSAFIIGQLSKLLLASSSGVSVESIMAIEQNSHAILAWGILFAALNVPPNLGVITIEKEESEVGDAILLFLNELLPGFASFALIVEIVNAIQSNVSLGTMDFFSANLDTLDKTTYVFICAICLREIGFFGALYKTEAIITVILCVCSSFSLNDRIGFSELGLTSLIALCLLVLSYGKVFEPIEDDLRPNKSSFFKDTR